MDTCMATAAQGAETSLLPGHIVPGSKQVCATQTFSVTDSFWAKTPNIIA